jgi:hypothetical protein
VNSSKHRYASRKTQGVEQRPAFICVLGPPRIHLKATISLVLLIPLSLPRRRRRSSASSPPLPTPPPLVASLDVVAATATPSRKPPRRYCGCVCAVGEESRILCFGGCSETLIDSSVVAFVQFHEYQVVGRALPTPSDEHPRIYRMKLWASNEIYAKSKFW